MKTAVEDEQPEWRDESDFLHGADGWTEVRPGGTVTPVVLDLLRRMDAVKLVKTTSGKNWEARHWITLEGKLDD